MKVRYIVCPDHGKQIVLVDGKPYDVYGLIFTAPCPHIYCGKRLQVQEEEEQVQILLKEGENLKVRYIVCPDHGKQIVLVDGKPYDVYGLIFTAPCPHFYCGKRFQVQEEIGL